MYTNKPIQSYQDAVTILEAGGQLSVKVAYDGKSEMLGQVISEVVTQGQLDQELYNRFADLVQTGDHLKHFVCGVCAEWDGTTHEVYDGSCFYHLRPAFMDALMHHPKEDGASYIWTFLANWYSSLVVVKSD